MWLRPQGYAVINSPESGKATLDGYQCEEVRIGSNEYDTTVCSHCNSITHVKARMDPAEIGGFCRACMKLVCRYCANGPCVPFMKKLDEMEKRDIALRSYGV